ncbi:DUF4157 domain-containing protein [Psychroserpens sp.]|uniref:eCIS core domain-containing protein n=1 Tax=Psychroserpens sp. TaxID=2020870 RepID=UPI002B274292|nr:DUF4157 domain-containing protein [Psychroserpens sp.]
MKTYSNKSKTKTSVIQKKVSSKSVTLVDNRNFTSIQRKVNTTGLPDQLKSGIENLSGIDMSDTKVHYNSSKPAQLNAHAYAQGTDIHLASGQEKHLPHEAWHVVQQKQGRVKPTMQLKGKVNVNDDYGLEKEADVMGAKALRSISFISGKSIERKPINSIDGNPTIQRLTDPHHDWAKILNVYNRYHNEYLNYNPLGAPPGNLDKWTENAAIVEARELSEWHGVKHLLTKNLAASFGADKTTEPDVFSAKSNVGLFQPQAIHHAVEHKFVSGGQDQVNTNINTAFEQLVRKDRAKNIRNSATAIITIKEHSGAADWIRQSDGNPLNWIQKLTSNLIGFYYKEKGVSKFNKGLVSTHSGKPLPKFSLIVQIEGEPPIFSCSIENGKIIDEIRPHVSHSDAPTFQIAASQGKEGFNKYVDKAGKDFNDKTKNIPDVLLTHRSIARGNFYSSIANSHNIRADYYNAIGDHLNSFIAHSEASKFHVSAANNYKAAGDDQSFANSVALSATSSAHSYRANWLHSINIQDHNAAVAAVNSAGHSHTNAGNAYAAAGNYASARDAHILARDAFNAANNPHAAQTAAQAVAQADARSRGVFNMNTSI